ncbi:MAG: aminoacetone oxidase family FAD-binding enzyme, partial [Bacteroidetes bacterium]|nr:aminoacetone oxidase family FAD-binding enzyme [Bacteroidota bacterium]
MDADSIIIGAGPSGLFTAIHLKDSKIIILEKNKTPGNKLLISGSGQCNLTHQGNIRDFLTHYGTNGSFLKTALYAFSNQELIDFFEERGLKMVADKNGKVFPQSYRAGDVLQVLLDECTRKKVTIITDSAVINVKTTAGKFTLNTADNEYSCQNLVISTGGLSYPSTGSTGDGYHFAGLLGHRIVPTRPALCPVFINDFSMAALAGISLQERSVYLYRDNKKIGEHRGDILFTHKGISGPGILDFSRWVHDGDVLKINLIDQKNDQFRKTFLDHYEKEGK